MSESEFISEAQEVIETFSRKLLEIEAAVRKGDDVDPDLLNASFRSVHTLKGLASLTTAAMFTYFPPSRKLTFSYAGHPPAWLWSARDGQWKQLHCTDRPDRGLCDLPLAV